MGILPFRVGRFRARAVYSCVSSFLFFFTSGHWTMFSRQVVSLNRCAWLACAVLNDLICAADLSSSCKFRGG